MKKVLEIMPILSYNTIKGKDLTERKGMNAVSQSVESKKVENKKIDLRNITVQNNLIYYALMFVPLLLIFIFNYLPMFGIIISFQDYSAGRPFLGAGVKWVGLKWFRKFVTSFYFPRILRNTLIINTLHLFMGFWVPIVFALAVNEIRNDKFRKITQTISYMPHFISTVIVATMVLSFIASDGIITKFAAVFGLDTSGLNANPRAFKWIYVLTSVWKSFGWSSILYLSTITSIDPTLYEAAEVDGCGRVKRIWHITIPHMLPLIMIQLIRSIGGMLGSNTDMILLLYNEAVYSHADVIGTFVYRETLLGGKYSYGTASGLLMSIMSFILVWCANTVSRKTTDFSMW